MRKIVFALLLLVTPIVACKAEKTTFSAKQHIISDFISAYNQQDIEGMVALAHPEIEWIYIAGTEAFAATKGHTAMATELTAHFAGPRRVTSRLGPIIENGNFLSVTETATWKDAEGKDKAQSSIAVYEIEDGHVRRVWYFPEQTNNDFKNQ